MTSAAPHSTLRASFRLALLFAAIKLLLHFACTLWSEHLGYSYFRDEFYYLACGRHLAWGYVDHGPIVAVQARLGEVLFGTSVFALRILSACAGAIAIALTGLIGWALGGGRAAQALAMSGLLVAGVYVGVGGYLSMNSCEPVFWMLCVLALLRVCSGSSARVWWTVFGISAGLGLLNKPSMTFFLIALGLGLLGTPQRRILFSRWAALGIALLILIALPDLLWQIHNHWPTLEFLRNGRATNKNVILNPAQFLIAQWLQMQPWNALLWITGLVSLLRARSIRNARWLGLTYLFFFALMCALHAKDYYLAPIYPFLFAAGAIAWEHRFLSQTPELSSRSTDGIGDSPVLQTRTQRRWVIPALAVWLILNGLVTLPFSAPILSPAAYVRYAVALHFQPKQTETAATSELPQFFADRFGWDELTAKIVAAYRALPPEQKAEVCIVTDNYGEAGALDLLGHRLEPSLPPAVSGHNSYWTWGPHGCTFQTVLSITGGTPADMHERYESVQVIGHLDNPLIMPYEHKNIYLFRHRRIDHRVVWSEWKSFE